MKEKKVVVENVYGREGEYAIKDGSNIIVGRFFLVDLRPENRSCIFRVNYYRKERQDLLKEAVRILIEKIFATTNTYKVNLLIDEDNNIRALTDLGLNLEGVIESNIINKGYYKNELLFGIDAISFENQEKTNVLRLKGLNIELKVLTPEDSEELLQYYIRNKKHLMAFEPAREESFYTLDLQKRILMESYKQYLNGTAIGFGVYKDGKFVGKIQLSNIVMGIFKSAFVGYSIDADHQNKGYMKEALRLVVDYSFDDMELHRIEASTLVDNVKSQKVLLGCGFKELGINEKYLFINGAWRDHKTFYCINNK